ncbi:7070_t:CDS:1, partial [Gigaspora margarita]
MSCRTLLLQLNVDTIDNRLDKTKIKEKGTLYQDLPNKPAP